MKSLYQKCALGLGIAAMVTASSLNATSFLAEKVVIPFQFRVANVTMPAGEYRVQQSFSNDIAYLINVNTGQQVQVLRATGERVEGKARLVFENSKNGYTLKRVS